MGLFDIFLGKKEMKMDEPIQENTENEDILQEKLIPSDSEEINKIDYEEFQKRYKELGIFHEDNMFSDTSFNKVGNTQLIKTKIKYYRELASNPEIESIIEEDIANEAIVTDNEEMPVKLEISKDSIPGITQKTINLILKKFDLILNFLNFKADGESIFKRWYVDGRLYIGIVMNSDKTSIIGLKVLDPLNLETRVIKQKMPNGGTQDKIVFVYSENKDIDYGTKTFNNLSMGLSSTQGGFGNLTQNGGTSKNEIIFEQNEVVSISSGIYDYLYKIFISKLEFCIKPLNQLSNLEDAMVLHQFIRSVNRRVFYVNTGNLSFKKAEEYLASIQKRHKESLGLKYDTTTGEIKLDSKIRVLSLFDDYFIKADGNTRIDTLGGDNSSEWTTIIEKISYFRKKLYKVFNVPYSRYIYAAGQDRDGSTYKMSFDGMGLAEIKYMKNIYKLRNRFQEIFVKLLEKIVLFEGILKEYEWDLLKPYLTFIWTDSNYFSEVKKLAGLKQRLDILREIKDYEGKYFSERYIFSKVLGFTDDEIAEMKKEINDEKMLKNAKKSENNEESGRGGPGAGNPFF